MSLSVKIVSDEKELEKIFKLRYKVYCQEWGFDSHVDHNSRMITDKYDEHALHFVACDDAQKIIGAIMLILNASAGYPIENCCELNIDCNELPREHVAEISRLVIHRDYRRRAEDKYIYGHDEDRRSIGSFHFPQSYAGYSTHYRRADDKFRMRQNSRRSTESYSDRRRRHEVLISLYKAVYQESKRRDISHWYTFLTQGILNLLVRFGFEFREIGDPVDYHGIRTPYLAEIAKMEQEMLNKAPELYDEFNRGL